MKTQKAKSIMAMIVAVIMCISLIPNFGEAEVSYAAEDYMDGATFVADGYTYTYHVSDDSAEIPIAYWSVKANDKNVVEAAAILESDERLAGHPVVDASECFAGCRNLKSVAAIPDTVEKVVNMFKGCDKLENVPDNFQSNIASTAKVRPGFVRGVFNIGSELADHQMKENLRFQNMKPHILRDENKLLLAASGKLAPQELEVKFVVGEGADAEVKKYTGIESDGRQYFIVPAEDIGRKVQLFYTNLYTEETEIYSDPVTLKGTGTLKFKNFYGEDSVFADLKYKFTIIPEDSDILLNPNITDASIGKKETRVFDNMPAGTYYISAEQPSYLYSYFRLAGEEFVKGRSFKFEIKPGEITYVQMNFEEGQYTSDFLFNLEMPDKETLKKYPGVLSRDFEIAIKFEALEGSKLPEKVGVSKKGNPEKGPVTFSDENLKLDRNGNVTFSAQPGTFISVLEIPGGIKYRIVPAEKDGWGCELAEDSAQPYGETTKGPVYTKFGVLEWIAFVPVKIGSSTPPSTPPEEGPKEYPVVFSKQDADGNELAGASIEVKQGSEVIESWTSTGKTRTIDLKPGSYTFEETAAPEGYKIATKISFNVDKEGNVTVSGTTVSGGSDNVIVMVDEALPKDEPKGYPVQFSKRNLAGEELKGATITVTKQGETEPLEIWVSDGTMHTFTLETGSYVFRETAAPLGYKLAAEIKFTVAEDGTVTSTDAEVQGTNKNIIAMVDEYELLPELPNPNEPDSPDRVVIEEDGVPTTYKKVPNPDNPEEFIYVPDEEVPLIAKTGTRAWMNVWLVLVMISSAVLTALVLYKRKMFEE